MTKSKLKKGLLIYTGLLILALPFLSLYFHHDSWIDDIMDYKYNDIKFLLISVLIIMTISFITVMRYLYIKVWHWDDFVDRILIITLSLIPYLIIFLICVSSLPNGDKYRINDIKAFFDNRGKFWNQINVDNNIASQKHLFLYFERMKNLNISHLSLCRNNITDNQASVFFKNMKNMHISSLNLSSNSITLGEKASHMENIDVHHLSITHNKIKSIGFYNLASKAKVSSLDISNNLITLKDLPLLKVKNNIYSLDLQNNKIEKTGLNYLVNNIKMFDLKEINLGADT
jgi:hypothetical protein